jgi:hypothetical protein
MAATCYAAPRIEKNRRFPYSYFVFAWHQRRCSSVVEQGFHKAKVAGSIPAIGTISENKTGDHRNVSIVACFINRPLDGRGVAEAFFGQELLLAPEFKSYKNNSE